MYHNFENAKILAFWALGANLWFSLGSPSYMTFQEHYLNLFYNGTYKSIGVKFPSEPIYKAYFCRRSVNQNSIIWRPKPHPRLS